MLPFPKPNRSLRFRVDYRRLNAVTVKDAYPLPRMDECLDAYARLLGPRRDSRVWQLRIPEEDREKTALPCHSGLFRVSRMPFGLKNSPAYFQSPMDISLSPFRWNSCIFYRDDIIIFPKKWEEHVEQVDDILSVLEGLWVKLTLRKCEFFVDKVKYLGHIVRLGTIEADQAHMAALHNVKYRPNRTEVRSFSGLCNVYRRFFPYYSKLVHPLNQLLKKGMQIRLGPLEDRCQKFFGALRDAILSPPILALPRKNSPYFTDTDASNYQIGVAPLQTHEDGTSRPL